MEGFMRVQVVFPQSLKCVCVEHGDPCKGHHDAKMLFLLL